MLNVELNHKYSLPKYWCSDMELIEAMPPSWLLLFESLVEKFLRPPKLLNAFVLLPITESRRRLETSIISLILKYANFKMTLNCNTTFNTISNWYRDKI